MAVAKLILYTLESLFVKFTHRSIGNFYCENFFTNRMCFLLPNQQYRSTEVHVV